LKLDNS